jgi:hypothetical protein
VKQKKLPILFAMLCALVTAQTALPIAISAQIRVANYDTEVDPRGQPEITLCSQNLENYGALRDVQRRDPGMTPQDMINKEADLVKRFIDVGCDVIAVQEVLGRSQDIAFVALEHLANILRQRTNRFFAAVVGDGDDSLSRTGFLYARDKFTLLNKVIFTKVELPRITPEDKPDFFSRAPFEIQLATKPSVHSDRKVLNVINIHFKSKRAGQDDPAALDFETTRMSMAEAVRRIALSRHRRTVSLGESLLVIMGDRNSNRLSASARILEGGLRLADFLEKENCRLSQSGFPLCKAGANGPQDFFSVLLSDPGTSSQSGTYKYNGKHYWIDDILMPQSNLAYAFEKYDLPGDYDAGVIFSHPNASDHGMVWTKLNW